VAPQERKYRLYVYDAEGRLIAPPVVISADNDEAAAALPIIDEFN
jgi:hypothetical protein